MKSPSLAGSSAAKSFSTSAGRLLYLDWFRGCAALIMLQGHTFHAFTKPELRDQPAYVLSQFVGGMPPAVFLFLLGVTLGFRLDGAERKGLGPWRRVGQGLRRAGYLLGLAFLFRLQMWIFGLPNSPWTDLLRVDILNSMALAAAVLSLMALFRTGDRTRLCAVLGVAIAAAAPVASAIDWSGTPLLVKQYLAPDYALFGFFPWAAFLAFGMSVGSILRRTPDEHTDRLMQWFAIAGGGLILGGRYFAGIPYSLYPKSEFWLDSPMLIFIKLGVLLWMMTFAFVWTRYAAPARWSWIRQLGTTSLLVYWVHVELVYGRWLWFWKEQLEIGQVVVASAVVTLLMLALSVLKTHPWSGRPASFTWYPFMASRVPSRVPAD